MEGDPIIDIMKKMLKNYFSIVDPLCSQTHDIGDTNLGLYLLYDTMFYQQIL